jgi:hypothetical protein
MKALTQVACLVAFLPCAAVAAQAPEYTADGRLIPPTDYREWIFLSSGLDMSYLQLPPNPLRASMFGNVFVNPQAYRVFMKTGVWPDKTMFVAEHRLASGKGSINKNGKFQTDIVAVEIHLKDEARNPGKWAFFAPKGAGPAEKIPETAACYSCHSEHAAVDTTFVQFYPTLLGIAKTKGTLSPAYLKEEQSTAATSGAVR